mmetsp:Transcript_3998/g.17692  ORF Transcript_3998/g.17692 Transcript_3998/m.17692 type:complete len:114 (-) Transcript_3998:3460-3801(-)
MSIATDKQQQQPQPPPKGGGGVFKNAALQVLRKERRLMSTGEVTRTAIRMGIIGSLPGKTPEATMASALYTDIKKWKDGKAGSVFCRWVPSPAIPPRTCEKVGPGPKIDKIDT